MECQEEIGVANDYWRCVQTAEQELVMGNSWFKKNIVYKYTWLRLAAGRAVDRSLMDYVLPTIVTNSTI